MRAVSETASRIDAASQAQRHAADPSGSRFASANAGSGKTHVLVSRVSRLLIAGVAPDKILCLTYTKAAASEMQTRLFESLGEWSVMPETALDQALEKLFGHKNHGVKLSSARALFAKALETPGGLKVQTIHAFCEFVLSRFPVEIGLLPGFETLQDEERLLLLKQAEKEVLSQAKLNPNGDIANAVRFFAATSADMTLEKHFAWMGYNIYGIQRWENEGGLAPLAKHLNLPLGTQPDDICAAAWEATDKLVLKELCPQLISNGAATNQKVGAALDRALVETDPVIAFKTYRDIFFTQKGDVRASIVTAKAPELAQTFLGAKAYMPTDEVSRILEINQQIKAAELLQATQSLYALAIPFAEAFESAKAKMRRISFNDQVELVRALLIDQDVSDWVRYKLDGGISHILVDEAQDTPPVQWDILDSLHKNFDPKDPDQKTGLAKTFFAVGDEKQSIYSFQGARPETFLSKTQDYDEGDDFKAPRMTTSFRSTRDILELVDQVFIEGGGSQRMFDPEKFAPAGDKMRHVAVREDRGYVELWPLWPRPITDMAEDAGDLRPLDDPGDQDAREVLAAKIAQEIKSWLDQGRPVFDRKANNNKGEFRPIKAGDVLILVQKRKELYQAVLRHLKKAHVPVVGPDRLVLKDALVVKDLLTLARFVLQPSDDLALAELLKGPFFNWDDAKLFELAYGRGGTLWQALKASLTAQATAAASTLNRAIIRAKHLAPYEFFARFLDECGADGVSHLSRIYQRLSMEVKDAVQSFLARALAHQRRGVPSLHDFTASFRHDETELKRELDNVTDQVRIMTVHGAKGLEAPIVILPDTTLPARKIGRGDPIRPWKSGYVFASKSSTGLALADDLFDAASNLEQQEYMRRLYVALTRAETELIICGFEQGRKKPAGEYPIPPSWYTDVKSALENLEGQTCKTPFGDGLSYGVRAEQASGAQKRSDIHADALPSFLSEKAPSPVISVKRVTPSHMAAGLDGEPAIEAPVRSPLTQSADRFKRGILIHKLLEFLPDIEPHRQEQLAANFLSAHQDISPHQSTDILNTVFNVLRHPDYSEFFGANDAVESRAEVSISGRAKTLPDEMLVSGQIDRLCIYPDRVLILDYKSNRPPPENEANVAPLYMMQMASYAALMGEAYPNHKIECALLWTDGPRLMKLSETSMAAALTRITSLPNYKS